MPRKRIVPTRRKKKTTLKKRVAKKTVSRAKTGKAKTMARRKKSRPKTKTRTVTQVRYRKPPKRRRKASYRPSAKRGIAGIDLQDAVKGSLALSFGMIAAKAAVNKVTAGGSETERWSWPNIATAAISGFLVSFAAGSLLNLKQSTTRMIFMGGLTLAMYKAFTTKLAPQWGWTESWFGADDDIHPDFLGTDQAIHPEFMGDIYDPVVGTEPTEAETNEMLEGMGGGFAGELVPYDPAMGEDLVPYDPAMGESLVPVVPEMGSSDRAKTLNRKSKAAYPGSY